MLKSSSGQIILLVQQVDLGKYIRKNDAKAAKQYSLERKCLQCSKLLRNEGEPIYYQRFCSKTCKERYVGMPLDD